jgi:phosphohistidine phosphatase
MKLYLMQHGNPVSKDIDKTKPLSKQGIEDVNRVARFLATNGIKFDELLHSGKVRAEQTAEIIKSIVCEGITPVERDDISHLDDVSSVAGYIISGEKDIMIVGHLPHLSRLTSFLVTGSESGDIAAFKQGGIVCLSQAGDKWAISWMIIPELMANIQ